MADKENESKNNVSNNDIDNIEAGGDVYIGSSEHNIDSKNEEVGKKPSDIGPSPLSGLLPVYRIMYENLSNVQQISISLLMIFLGGGGVYSVNTSIISQDMSLAFSIVGVISIIFGVGYFITRHENKCPNSDCEEPFTFRPLDDAKEVGRNETEQQRIIELERTWECSKCGYSEVKTEKHTFDKTNQNNASQEVV